MTESTVCMWPRFCWPQVTNVISCNVIITARCLSKSTATKNTILWQTITHKELYICYCQTEVFLCILCQIIRKGETYICLTFYLIMSLMYLFINWKTFFCYFCILDKNIYYFNSIYLGFCCFVTTKMSRLSHNHTLNQSTTLHFCHHLTSLSLETKVYNVGCVHWVLYNRLTTQQIIYLSYFFRKNIVGETCDQITISKLKYQMSVTVVHQ